jgi:hypothetical protein
MAKLDSARPTPLGALARRLYKPIWEYDLPTLWKDLSAHLVYGLGTAATFRATA